MTKSMAVSTGIGTAATLISSAPPARACIGKVLARSTPAAFLSVSMSFRALRHVRDAAHRLIRGPRPGAGVPEPLHEMPLTRRGTGKPR
jgi:hypothetical protein